MGGAACRQPPSFSPARILHVKSRLGGGRSDPGLGVLPKLGRRSFRLRRSFFACVDAQNADRVRRARSAVSNRRRRIVSSPSIIFSRLSVLHRYRHAFHYREQIQARVGLCYTLSVGLHGAPIRLSKRWGNLCIQKIALDRWNTCAVSGRRLPAEKRSTGWRKRKNGENSRNLPTRSSRGCPSSSIGARSPAITELTRCGTLPLTG
jgi:hypothetical protein